MSPGLADCCIPAQPATPTMVARVNQPVLRVLRIFFLLEARNRAGRWRVLLDRSEAGNE
jgi:hypothetical protein